MNKEEKNPKMNSWIDWVQLSFVGLAAPFFLFPSIKYTWIFLIIAGTWVLRWTINKQLFPRTIIDWAIALLCIQVFATCMIVSDLSFSLPKIAGVVYGLFIFYSIVAILNSEKLIKWGVTTFLGGGLVLSIISIFGMRLGYDSLFISVARVFCIKLEINKLYKIITQKIPKIDWNIPGAEEGFNPNAVGGVLILIIPLFLVFLISYLKRKKEEYMISQRIPALVLLFVISIIMCSILFFTQSISSWIGLIISIWILMVPWKWKKWSFLITFLITASLFISTPKKTASLIDAFKNDEDIAYRRILYAVGVNSISQKPFFGIGMNQIRQDPSVSYERSHVHNHLVHTAAELGIPGLISYLSILIGIGFMCFIVWQKSDVGWIKMTALGLGCGQLAHLIFGMGDSIPLGAKVGLFFWFSLALIAALYNYTIEKNIDLNRN